VTPDRGPLLRWVLLVSTAYLVQVGVVVDLSIFGVHPDLMLLVAASAGIVAGPARGAEVGFASGLLADLVLQGPLGTTALAYAVVGFGAGAVGEALMRTSRAISVAVVTAASAAGTLLYALLGQLLGQRTLSDPRLWSIVAIVALCNAALCLPALAASRWAEGEGLRTGVG
jgi:rod shape-determining protein MreD